MRNITLCATLWAFLAVAPAIEGAPPVPTLLSFDSASFVPGSGTQLEKNNLASGTPSGSWAVDAAVNIAAGRPAGVNVSAVSPVAY